MSSVGDVMLPTETKVTNAVQQSTKKLARYCSNLKYGEH